MQVQLNVAAPAPGAQAGNPPGHHASAGDASFSQLLNQATPREAPASPNAPSPRADRPAASEQPRPSEHAEKAAARDDASTQDADTRDDDTPPHAADTALAAAAMSEPAVAVPAIAPADPSLATWLATFNAAVAAAADPPAAAQAGSEVLVDPTAARAAQPQAPGTLPGTAFAAEPVAADRHPVETAVMESAGPSAQRIARDASRGAEAALSAPALPLRAQEPPPVLADLSASAIASVTAGGAPGASIAAPAAPAATAPTLQLPHPVGSAEFAPTLALTLTRLARDGVQEARLQLHPAEMGPIDVRIAVDGTQARVDFSADVAATRFAIEAGLPTLAGALRESGLTLAGGSVFQHAREQREHAVGDGSARGERAADEAELASVAAVPRRATVGVVDLYA